MDADGHDPDGLAETLRALAASDDRRPKAVVAKTICGKGASFMEGQVKWHYWPMSDEEYRIAMEELAADERKGRV